MSDRLELGSGPRPTDGYLHQDISAFDGVDFICPAEKLGLPDGSLVEVIALGVVEHMTYKQVDATFMNVYRMLESGGVFLLDVPELLAWCEYYSMSMRGEKIPFTRDHVLSTIYGWQRFEGDTHASGWSQATLDTALRRAGFKHIEYGVDHFLDRGHHRRRMTRPEDAHIYCCATK